MPSPRRPKVLKVTKRRLDEYIHKTHYWHKFQTQAPSWIFRLQDAFGFRLERIPKGRLTDELKKIWEIERPHMFISKHERAIAALLLKAELEKTQRKK